MTLFSPFYNMSTPQAAYNLNTHYIIIKHKSLFDFCRGLLTVSVQNEQKNVTNLKWE